MIMSGSSNRVIRLYRAFLRAARRFESENLASYVARRAREQFRANAGVSTAEVPQLILRGEEQLKMVERQAIISSLFSGGVGPNVVKEIMGLKAQR